jgi:phosphoglycerol transferase MdoB-like AlkP superfamily enzyme
LGQDIYLTLFNGLFSIIDIVNVKEGADFAKGVYTFSVYHIIYMLILIGTLVLYLRKHHNPHLPFKYGFIKLSQVSLLLILLVNVNAVYPVKSARLHTSDHYIYYSNYDKERIASKFSMVNMFYRDVIQVITPDFSYKSNLKVVDDYYDKHHKNIVYHDKHGIYEDKNLVFILAESFDDVAISETLTPNIYALQNEGLNFTNHFTPVYPRTTCDTEIIINTGLIPSINDGPTCYMFNENTYDNSLASLFNDKGYQTRAFHNNDESFYTRDTLYIGFAYNQFSGRETLGLSLEDIRYDNIFFDRIKEHYKTPDQSPFYSFILTLSGHSPYTLDNLAVKKHIEKVNAYYGDSISLDLKYYIASQIELDILIGNLMDDLQATNQLDDTVIILMNDHYPYTLDQSTYESAKGVNDVHEKQKGTLIIWSKDTPHQEINRLTSSFDVLPTIASLFNLDMNYTDYVGIDMFDETKKPYVYFKDYFVYDGESYIDIFNPKDAYEAHVHDQAMLYYEYSIAALKTNYHKKDQ